MSKPLTIDDLVSRDPLATLISDHYVTWESSRIDWLEEQSEKIAYLNARSTNETSVGESTPWKNNTTIPKLTQIRDNLHANIMQALFPNSKWLDWRGSDASSSGKQKRQTILAYNRNKLEESKFRTTMSKLVLDWIDYGNCFAIPVYEANKIETSDGETINGFHGSKAHRISPYDIVFDPTASTFESTPKIVRSIKTMGELEADILNKPEMKYLEEAFSKTIEARRSVAAAIGNDTIKSEQLENEGFSGVDAYYQSHMVEILDYYGDIYNPETGTLETNQLISVVDRSFVIRKETNPSWLGKAPIFHCGWRERPDNLWAMSPLDNLVGMQFMMDKLQNSKADILDQIIHPVRVVRGQVDLEDHAPNATYYAYDDGSVEYLRPDATALQNNNEIFMLEQKMEEYAGAPKQAMGFRTPGEKTKFEVQVLDNGNQRMTLNKTAHFEEVFEEPLLNMMFEQDRRLLSDTILVSLESDTFNSQVFKEISKEDLSANGYLRPIGARYFAERANQLQNLQTVGGFLLSNPATSPHVSGKELARVSIELAGFESERIVQDNVAVVEQADTQATAQVAQQVVAEQQAAGVPEVQPDLDEEELDA